MFKWSDKAYDVVKTILTKWVAPFLVLLTGLAQIPQFAGASDIFVLIAMITALVATFLGQGMGISTTIYNKTLTEDSTEK